MQQNQVWALGAHTRPGCGHVEAWAGLRRCAEQGPEGPPGRPGCGGPPELGLSASPPQPNMHSGTTFYQDPRSFCVLLHTGSFSHLPPGQCPTALPRGATHNPSGLRGEKARSSPPFHGSHLPGGRPPPPKPQILKWLSGRGQGRKHHTHAAPSLRPVLPGRPNLFQERGTLVQLQQVVSYKCPGLPCGDRAQAPTFGCWQAPAN